MLVDNRGSMRAAVACAVVGLLGCYAALDYYGRTRAANRKSPDFYRIGVQEPRFREIAKEFPEDAIVGYISDVDTDTVIGGTAFFGAQYVLTPRVLVDWDDPESGELVLGNFADEAQLADTLSRLARDHGLRVVREFEAGVVLFRKTPVGASGGSAK